MAVLLDQAWHGKARIVAGEGEEGTPGVLGGWRQSTNWKEDLQTRLPIKGYPCFRPASR